MKSCHSLQFFSMVFKELFTSLMVSNLQSKLTFFIWILLFLIVYKSDRTQRGWLSTTLDVGSIKSR